MDKCREAFEKKFPIPAHWIEFDEKRNKYYCPNVADAKASEYQEMWEVWQSRQTEVDQLNKTLSIKSKFLDDSDVTNKFLSEQLKEKDKRIEELEMWIKGQIETLKCASKSWVYTEREQNLMLSQADDLEKALRGEQ